MPKFYGAIDLAKNELQNAAIQNLGAAPSTPVKGQIYLNTTDNTLYYWDGTTWQAVKSGTGGPPTGTAGGDLSGTYPNPTVAKASGSFPVTGDITVVSAGGVIKALKLTDGTGANPVSITNPNGQGVTFQGATGGPLVVISGAADQALFANGGRVSGVADPTVGQDAANKRYVDGVVQGLAWKQPCRAATIGSMGTIAGLAALDGVAIVAGDRILVKNQATPAQNGIYVAASGSWARAVDMDAPSEFPNAAVFVSEGTTQADTQWQCTTNAPVTVDTTAITWTQIGAASSYIGGAGLTLTGNTFDVGAGTGIVVGADTVAVDTAVVALKSDLAGGVKKYSALLAGNVAYATGEVVVHNLNTKDVHVSVINGNAPYQAVEVDWEATSVNAVTLRYNPNLPAQHRVVVIG